VSWDPTALLSLLTPAIGDDGQERNADDVLAGIAIGVRDILPRAWHERHASFIVSAVEDALLAALPPKGSA
jgi:hypothetical protein